MLSLKESLNEIIALHDELMKKYEANKEKNEFEMESLNANYVLLLRTCLESLAKSHVIENIEGKWSVVGRIETIIHIEDNSKID
ncbi:hypothetical protein [Pelosinus baikalensis]|uniref:Uncharacterized protein n=1 Tax=Pelosinus baikalensis TaxID=2892015 RepID=A0ABS8I1Y4_9FIRM|nr:hypothetical protein [Pelosinus baikalensis]MCC5468692.1 hypothetical protein [Pelosinus baikalensis]